MPQRVPYHPSSTNAAEAAGAGKQHRCPVQRRQAVFLFQAQQQPQRRYLRLAWGMMQHSRCQAMGPLMEGYGNQPYGQQHALPL